MRNTWQALSDRYLGATLRERLWCDASVRDHQRPAPTPLVVVTETNYRGRSVRVQMMSVGVQRVKHNLAGDAKEIRQREKRNLWNVLREDKNWIIQSIPSTFWWSNRFKIHPGWSRRRPFFRHALKKKNSLEHCRATDNTTLAYISLRMSTLRFMMRKRLAPTVMMFPSGSSESEHLCRSLRGSLQPSLRDRAIFLEPSHRGSYVAQILR